MKFISDAEKCQLRNLKLKGIKLIRSIPMVRGFTSFHLGGKSHVYGLKNHFLDVDQAIFPKLHMKRCSPLNSEVQVIKIYICSLRQ